MVRKLNDIWDVSIALGNAAFERQSFGYALFVDEQASSVTTRTAEYTEASELLSAGYSESDTIYKMAVDYFSQEFKPEKLIVGKKEETTYNKWTITLDAAPTAGTFTITTDGDATATIAYDATISEIQEAINAAIGTDKDACIVSSKLTDLASPFEFVIQYTKADYAAVTMDVTSLTGVTTATPSDDAAYDEGETWTTALNAIQADDDTWYVICSNNNDFHANYEIAEWVSTKSKLFLGLTLDDDVFDKDEDADIVSLINDLSTENVKFYATKTADNYLQAAVAGNRLPKDGYGVSWANFQISSVSADSELTANENTAMKNKNVGHCQNLAGITGIFNAVTCGDEWVDTVIGKHYLVANLEAELATFIFNINQNSKLNYDGGGRAALIAELNRILIEFGVDANIIVDGSIVIDAPLIEDISSTTKNTRIFPDIDWSATLTGAINGGSITGILTA